MRVSFAVLDNDQVIEIISIGDLLRHYFRASVCLHPLNATFIAHQDDTVARVI
jgi:hypothetical protein